MRETWSPALDALFRAIFPVTPTPEVARRLWRSRSSIKNRAAALHLRKDRSVSMRKRWLPEEDDAIRRRYPDEKTDAIARDLGRPLQSIYRRARQLGVDKSEAYLASPAACRLRRGDNVGIAYRFKPGQVPPNKGLRGRRGYAPGRMAETQFKKGKSRNKMPLFSTRLVDGYVYVKVAEVSYVPYTVNWKPLHILMWERANGRPLPDGHVLAFKNHDRLDVRLENLELLTRRDNMARNTVHNLPPELKQSVQLLGALNRKINRRSRREEQARRSA